MKKIKKSVSILLALIMIMSCCNLFSFAADKPAEEVSLLSATAKGNNYPFILVHGLGGWGQYDADRIFGELKEYDPTRIWDATSGWWSEKESDVQSEHIYFKKLDLKSDGKHPLVLSEFGGYSCKVEGHSFNLDKTYGYRFFSEMAEFEAALHKLYREEVIPMIERGLCATVLTQVSDVEDETNGLLTYDRKVLKVNAEEMNRISNDVTTAFNKEITKQNT